MDEKQYLILLVENNSGVLARITTLFCQRGFNIDSLNVSTTDNPKISRITIVTHGDEKKFRQIIRQTDKLIESKMIFAVEPSLSLLRELLLLKLEMNSAEEIAAAEAVCRKYGCSIIDHSVGTLVLEFTGTPDEIDALLEDCKQFGILELCRTGVTALERGKVSYTID